MSRWVLRVVSVNNRVPHEVLYKFVSILVYFSSKDKLQTQTNEKNIFLLAYTIESKHIIRAFK